MLKFKNKIKKDINYKFCVKFDKKMTVDYLDKFSGTLLRVSIGDPL